MKKISMFFVMVLIVIGLSACSSSKEVTADYTTSEAEQALNDGKDLEGKTVKIKVDTLVPDGALGYTIQTGEHLNFVSSENPKVEEGDEIIVKIDKVSSAMGSFIITYDKQ